MEQAGSGLSEEQHRPQTSFAPKEETLDVVVGTDENGSQVFYRTTFFESHIARIIVSKRLGKMVLCEPSRIAYMSGFFRQTSQNMEGIVGAYRRIAGPGMAGIEDWNDHRKINEIVEFRRGIYVVSLQKGEYAISVKHGGKAKEAEDAVESAYISFRDSLGGRTLRNPLEEKPRICSMGAGEIIAEFGTRDNGIELMHEVIFQYEALVRMMENIKVRKSG